MTQSLITSAVSETKIGHLNDLTTPVLRRLLKDDEQAQVLIEAGRMFQDRLVALVSELLAELTSTYMVTVDYSRSFADSIKAGGYGYVNPDINAENFPVKKEGRHDLEVMLIQFGKSMRSEDVLARLRKLGLQAATLHELAAFGATHPDVQRQFPVAALGSIWMDHAGLRNAPYLADWAGKRRLLLGQLKEEWSADCRFAAIPKQPRTGSQITPKVSESKIGRIKDLFTPVLRRLLKDDNHAQAIIEAGGSFQDQFSARMSDLFDRFANTYTVTVDYSLSLPDMIKAGEYDLVNRDINPEHFQVTGENNRKAKVVLMQFGKEMKGEDVLAKLDAANLRPARIEELLAFGASYPWEQNRYPVVALGSFWTDRDSNCLVPCLDRWFSLRRLHLWDAGIVWGELNRFAAVQK